MTRATSSASSSGCSSLGAAANHAAAPHARALPSTAATWPCGSERSMVKTSSARGTATPPRSSTFKPSTTSGARHERLASVRLRTLPCSRQDSRRRIAGGDVRLGTASMYMGS